MGAGRRRSKSRKGRVLHWTRTWPSEWSSHARRRKRIHGTLASGSYRTLRWPSPEFLHSSLESAEPAEANETSRDLPRVHDHRHRYSGHHEANGHTRDFISDQ